MSLKVKELQNDSILVKWKCEVCFESFVLLEIFCEALKNNQQTETFLTVLWELEMILTL